MDDIEQKIEQTDFSSAKEVLKLSRDIKNEDLWKIYGRESEAGKLLYKIFGKGAPQVKINYPKPKTRPRSSQENQPPKPKVIPPSKTVIEYPPIKKPVSYPTIHPVDLIPKRKPEHEIRKEIETYYKKPYIPPNKGVNRKELVKNLQEKFKKSRGALPKGAELPELNPELLEELEKELNEEEIKQRALKKVPQKNLTFINKKPDENQEKKPMTKEEEDAELEALYEQVEKEIEERQQYLEEISHLDEPELKKKIKNEIVERISELEKIIKLLHKK